MFNLSENYYLRKRYLQEERVPNISMMKMKMTPPLAAVYFNSMKPRLKELAGLEPSLKGGGQDWFQPPEDLLKGRAVLKPVRKEVLAELNYEGIAKRGEILFRQHRKALALQVEATLMESDINWRNSVTATTRQLWDSLVAAAKKKNSKQIMNDFNHFVYLYRQSIGKIEILFHESAIQEIKNTREKAIHAMQSKYEASLKHQATMLYDEYEKKLMEEKSRLKLQFIQNAGVNHTVMANKIHDLNVDKHKAIEKVRQCLQCQNLACQIYVALKEREECLRETEEMKYTHHKAVRVMTETIRTKDVEINLAEKKEKKRQEFCRIWKKKVCQVVKSFQMFVSYCLNMLPEYAEFFINMEKLMLLQLNEALEDPTVASIIEREQEQYKTPVRQVKPFYLFCDRGYKAEVRQDLCPKHSDHSSHASELPVVIINKRCLYAACDNFEQFTNKIMEFIGGNRGDDADIQDDLIYEHFVPVKYGSSQQLAEIKLETSLQQILQQEIPYMQTDKEKHLIECKCGSVLCRCPQIENKYEPCSRCGLPWCSCPCPASPGVIENIEVSSTTSHTEIPKPIGRRMELDHEREPRWESFCRYVEPKKCSCVKTAKKHLEKHLPVYMRHIDRNYGPPDVPAYEICSINALRAMVKDAANEIPMSKIESPRTKDIGTQYHDPEFDRLCTCFTGTAVSGWLIAATMQAETEDKEVGAPSSVPKRMSSFAMARAYSLRNLLEDLPDLKEIFSRKDCTFK